MDWFERLFGFRESSYAETQGRFELDGDRLTSRVNGRGFRAGALELVSLGALRSRVGEDSDATGRLRFRNVTGNVRDLHGEPGYAGAFFQAASQFNLLEMVDTSVSPEDGVTGYQFDHTQGPACAMAAAGGLILRNYFVPVGGGVGQTRDRQLDGLADLASALAVLAGRDVGELVTMRNGYAICGEDALRSIDRTLGEASERDIDQLRARLRIGLHLDVEVTDAAAPAGQTVSQAYCSALPVSYNTISTPVLWRRFATVVLEAAYEATLLAAALNARRRGSNVVLLTRLGGGAFGNDDEWIDRALRRALRLCDRHDIDVRLVNFHAAPASMAALEREMAAR